MKTKGDFPLSSFAGVNLSPLVSAYFELNQLKQLFRQGWLRRGVPPERCESVAEHVFSMAVLAWWTVGSYYPDIDRDRVLQMVLAHELGEIYTGDLIPADHVSAEEKHRLERENLLRVVEKLPNGNEFLALWEEFEAGETTEARLVRQIDRLEMAFQAAVYEKQGLGNMGEFFESTRQTLTDPLLQKILTELEDMRD